VEPRWHEHYGHHYRRYGHYERHEYERHRGWR
jgi:hypothetical protein